MLDHLGWKNSDDEMHPSVQTALMTINSKHSSSKMGRAGGTPAHPLLLMQRGMLPLAAYLSPFLKPPQDIISVCARAEPSAWKIGCSIFKEWRARRRRRQRAERINSTHHAEVSGQWIKGFATLLDLLATILSSPCASRAQLASLNTPPRTCNPFRMKLSSK